MVKSYLYSIAYGCPKKDRAKDCPLSEIEHLLFKEKIDWIDEIDDEKKEGILTHHINCTKNKNTNSSRSNL